MAHSEGVKLPVWSFRSLLEERFTESQIA